MSLPSVSLSTHFTPPSLSFYTEYSLSISISLSVFLSLMLSLCPSSLSHQRSPLFSRSWSRGCWHGDGVQPGRLRERPIFGEIPSSQSLTSDPSAPLPQGRPLREQQEVAAAVVQRCYRKYKQVRTHLFTIRLTSAVPPCPSQVFSHLHLWDTKYTNDVAVLSSIHTYGDLL